MTPEGPVVTVTWLEILYLTTETWSIPTVEVNQVTIQIFTKIFNVIYSGFPLPLRNKVFFLTVSLMDK